MSPTWAPSLPPSTGRAQTPPGRPPRPARAEAPRRGEERAIARRPVELAGPAARPARTGLLRETGGEDRAVPLNGRRGRTSPLDSRGLSGTTHKQAAVALGREAGVWRGRGVAGQGSDGQRCQAWCRRGPSPSGARVVPQSPDGQRGDGLCMGTRLMGGTEPGNRDWNPRALSSPCKAGPCVSVQRALALSASRPQLHFPGSRLLPPRPLPPPAPGGPDPAEPVL